MTASASRRFNLGMRVRANPHGCDDAGKYRFSRPVTIGLPHSGGQSPTALIGTALRLIEMTP